MLSLLLPSLLRVHVSLNLRGKLGEEEVHNKTLRLHNDCYNACHQVRLFIEEVIFLGYCGYTWPNRDLLFQLDVITGSRKGFSLNNTCLAMKTMSPECSGWCLHSLCAPLNRKFALSNEVFVSKCRTKKRVVNFCKPVQFDCVNATDFF